MTCLSFKTLIDEHLKSLFDHVINVAVLGPRLGGVNNVTFTSKLKNKEIL